MCSYAAYGSCGSCNTCAPTAPPSASKGRRRVRVCTTHIKFQRGLEKDRMEITCEVFRKLLHMVAAGMFCFSIYYTLDKLPNPDDDSVEFKAGHFQYLTFWNLIIQALYFSMCVVSDVLEFCGREVVCCVAIRELKDKLFCCIAFPLAVFVSVTFWTLYACDRELIFPESVEPFFPDWLNHFVHTSVFVFAVVEILIYFRQYPRRGWGVTTVIVFMMCYLGWIIYLNNMNGKWPYPILDVFNWPMRYTFFGGAVIFIIFIYLIGEVLNRIVWRRRLAELEYFYH